MKKLNKFFAILVALAMMATLCVMSAFAEDSAPAYNGTAVTGGTEANPAQGYLTKVFQMPAGTTTPDADFTFDWTQKTTGNGIQTATADVTKLENTLAFDGETGSTNETTGVKTVTKTYPFANVSAFTKAGRYQFDVEELNATNNDTQNDAIEQDTAQTLTYSTEKYLVTIDVANGTNGLYIRNISVQKYNANGSLGGKVNPTIPQGGEGSEFSYTNNYVKNLPTVPDGNDPDDPTNPTPTTDDKGLYIEKKVKAYGDEQLTDADKAVPFTFSVKVTAPAVTGAKSSYKAKIVTVDTDATTATAVGEELTFVSGTAQDVTLKHNQRLVFEDLDVGAKYEVTEAADSGYKTTVIKTENGTAATAAETNAVASTFITEGKDSAEYTNEDLNSDTPTGILINNLPYIVLALVAIGGLCAYVIVRRKADDEA